MVSTTPSTRRSLVVEPSACVPWSRIAAIGEILAARRAGSNGPLTDTTRPHTVHRALAHLRWSQHAIVLPDKPDGSASSAE